MSGVVAQRRRHRADALQIRIAHRCAAGRAHCAAQRADRIARVELRAQLGRRGREFRLSHSIDRRAVEQAEKQPPRRGPEQRQHRARAHVDDHGQPRFLDAQDRRPAIAHHRDEARQRERLAQPGERGLRCADRLGLAHCGDADQQRLGAEVVLLRAAVLRYKAFLDQARQIAMHFRGTFFDVRGERRQRRPPAEPGQPLEHRHAGRGRLHALPAFARRGRIGGGRGRIARAGGSRGFQGRGLFRHPGIVVRSARRRRQAHRAHRVTTIEMRCRLTPIIDLRNAY